MITDELELFYQSEAMTNHPLTLTVALRRFIATCIASSLLMFPSFTSAQDNLGTLDQGSGSKVDALSEPLSDSPSEPLSEASPLEITPDPQQEAVPASPTDSVAGDTGEVG